MTAKTKFRISIKEFSIEFEGNQDLGQQINQGVTQALSGLMNTHDCLLTEGPQERREFIDEKIVDADPVKPNEQHNQALNGDKPKQPRQRRARAGPFVANFLLGLKQEGFFSLAHSSGEVLNHLKVSKAHTQGNRITTG